MPGARKVGILMKLLKRPVSIAACLILLAATLNTAACTARVQAADMMQGLSPQTVQGKAADDRFIANTAELSLELFKKTMDDKQNSLISPLSVLLALAMTANGADGETLAQMETVLGKGLSLDELNEYLYTYAQSLPNNKESKLTIANSIWFHEAFQAEKKFLQKNADYYNAAAYQSAFDNKTLRDINKWVKNNTDGMIDKILDEIAPDAVMYLINAITFDAQWKTPYKKEEISKGDFNAFNGSKQQVSMMRSQEGLYLEDGLATGFIKPYANDDYSLVALLPNQGTTVLEYIETLSGDRFLQLLNNPETTPVKTTMPMFRYDYTVGMNDALMDMGMPDAFSPDNADFSRLGKVPGENIYIGDVLHKTYISVDAQGTKAAAVTKVEMRLTSALEDTKNVILDRPFVYAIIDNSTNLPIFIGTVMEINE